MSVSAAWPVSANLAEYADPELYDLENPALEAANAFLLALVQEVGAPVLELGCGTGRLTIPLAVQGIDVTGLDVVPGMLARARRKAGHLPVQWIEADIRTFQLDRRFGLIFDAGEAFLHLLTRADHEAILARVHAHLAPAGRLVLVTGFPRPEMLVARQEHAWFSYTGLHGQEVRVSGTTRYDHVQQIYHEDAIRRWREADGQEVVRFAPLARRRFFPQELETLLHYNRFQVLHRYGDWDRSPLTDQSPLMIFVCQPIGEERG
jgi:SAM-dependent methyltransferase